jgi:hypothetical protein
LGYQIPDDKVMWDRYGNPKKLSLSSEKVVLGSPARPQSKKSRAHKNIGASSKAVADPQPTRTTVTSGPLPQSKAQGSSSASMVEEGSSVPKRKCGEDVSAKGPHRRGGEQIRQGSCCGRLLLSTLTRFLLPLGLLVKWDMLIPWALQIGRFLWTWFPWMPNKGREENRMPIVVGLRILLLQEMKRHRPRADSHVPRPALQGPF